MTAVALGGRDFGGPVHWGLRRKFLEPAQNRGFDRSSVGGRFSDAAPPKIGFEAGFRRLLEML
jgi:hypothetical protein